MLRPDLFDRYDMERRIHERLFCFGSDSADEDSGGGSDVSDEDLDESLQQDIAAAAVQQSGGNIGNYSFSPNFDQDDDDNSTLINATADILTAAAAAPPGQMQQAVDTGTAFAAQRPGVANALANAAQVADNIQQNELARVQQMSQNAGQVFFNELTGQYMPGALPNTRPQDFANASALNSPMTTGFGPPVVEPLAPSGVDDSVGGSNLPGATITDESGTTFDTTTGEIIQSFAGDQDDTDPFAGTGRTAMDVLGYDTTDQTNTAGFIRPFAGLTREQQANLEGRDDFVARNILAAQTPQPSGIPTTNLTGVFTYDNDPMGDVRGYSDFGPFGQTQVYTGFGGNPFAPPEVRDETTPPVTNPLTGTSRCPDGFIFDDDLQACRRKTRSELADTGSGGSPAPSTGDIFYRRSILDDAPAILPAGFDFNAANRRFIESYGVRPDNYRMPLSLTGFTRL